MEKCSHCNRDVNYNLIACPTCAEPLGHPNVRMAKVAAQKTALEKRYAEACQNATKSSCQDELGNFEQTCRGSFAVINENAKFLDFFLTRPNQLYSTYKKQVDAGLRIPASPEDSSMREAAEAIMFPDFGREITYAALSIDGRGLSSYGPITLRLKESAIGKRATVLKENSYDFVTDQNGRLYKHEDLPKGYMAVWDDRALLCVAKCHEEIKKGQNSDDYGRILLYSEGDRKTDRFLELHIYKSFDINAIKAVHGNSSIGNKSAKKDLRRIQERLKKKKIDWVEKN